MTNFRPLKVVGRGSETQLRVGENFNCILYLFSVLTLSILTLHGHLHQLQASNCCRSSRLEVGEKIKENYHVLVNQFHGNFYSKTLGCREIKSVFSDAKWCLMHREGLNGWGLADKNKKKHVDSGFTTEFDSVELRKNTHETPPKSFLGKASSWDKIQNGRHLN